MTTEISAQAITWERLKSMGLVSGKCPVLGVWDFEEADLRGLDFSGMYLRCCNFKKANLSNTRLIDSSLATANLREADLTSADLTNAGLWISDLRGVSAVHARFHNSFLNGARLQYANLSYAEIYESDCRETDFSQATLKFASIVGCDLHGAIFTGADLTDASIKESDVRQIVTDDTVLRNTRIENNKEVKKYWVPSCDQCFHGNSPQWYWHEDKLLQYGLKPGDLVTTCYYCGVEMEYMGARVRVVGSDSNEVAALMEHVHRLQRDDQKIKEEVSKKQQIRLMLVCANPIDTSRLRFDEEIRQVESCIAQSIHREQFPPIEYVMAARTEDLRRGLLKHRPNIVHFSGHGSSNGEIVLESEPGARYEEVRGITQIALASLFRILSDEILCVILNACYSETQARMIAEHIDCVIGMDQEISDPWAIAFSEGFYDGLAAGRSIHTAFELGCNSIELKYGLGHTIPRLLSRPGVNPKNIYLLR
jgi:uncharacterized protein YjbI with pentapeptide repeats